MSKKIIAIIPARKGSKGFPNKNISVLDSKPLIVHTIESAIKSTKIDEIVVSTDDERVKKIAIKYSEVRLLDRPKNLAEDDSSINDVILNIIESENNIDIDSDDLLILLQPTSPLRNSKHISESIEMFKNSSSDSLISATATPHPIGWMFKKNKNNYVKFLSESEGFKKRRQDFGKTYIPNGAIYISSCYFFKKNKSFFGKRTIFYEMSQESSVDVDSEMDLNLIRLIKRKGK